MNDKKIKRSQLLTGLALVVNNRFYFKEAEKLEKQRKIEEIKKGQKKPGN